MTPLGQKLREARLKKGLSMRKAAKQLGYTTHSNIQSWEQGWRKPRRENLERLAKLYEVDVNEFFQAYFK